MRFELSSLLCEIENAMQRRRMGGRSLLGVLLLGGFFVACDGGSDEGEPSGDGDGDMGGDTSVPVVECVPAEGVTDAVCVNDTDCPFIDENVLRPTAKDCLLNSCLNASDQASCTADCLVDELGATPECAACYGISGACSSENCLSECFADIYAPECIDCQAENGCTQSFFACSGLAEPE